MMDVTLEGRVEEPVKFSRDARDTRTTVLASQVTANGDRLFVPTDYKTHHINSSCDQF